MFWATCRHHVMPREQLCVPKESSFPTPSKYIDVVRHTKTNLDNLEESSIDDLWNNDGLGILSKCWSGSTRFCAHSKVIHGWIVDRNACHIETRNDMFRSVNIHVQMWSKESKAAIRH